MPTAGVICDACSGVVLQFAQTSIKEIGLPQPCEQFTSFFHCNGRCGQIFFAHDTDDATRAVVLECGVFAGQSVKYIHDLAPKIEGYYHPSSDHPEIKKQSLVRADHIGVVQEDGSIDPPPKHLAGKRVKLLCLSDE